MLILDGSNNLFVEKNVIFSSNAIDTTLDLKQNTKRKSMNTIDIKYFGLIEKPLHEELYEGSVFFEEAEVELNLHFFELPADDKWVEEIEGYLNELSQIKGRLEKMLKSDYRDGGIVKEYVNFQVENEPLILVDLFDDASLKSDQEMLRDALGLERIDFYPGEDSYAIWHFSIGRDYTDQQLVIRTDNKGRAEGITWES